MLEATGLPQPQPPPVAKVGLARLLAGVAAIQTSLNSETFCLHDLIARETATTPDEQRGRETILTYEAVVSAV